MKNTDISALANDVAEIIPATNNTPKTNNTGLIKLFIAAFILLLIYLLADKLLFKSGKPNSDGMVSVVGIYYGPANTKSNDEVLVSLGKLNELQKGITQTKQIKEPEITKPTINKPVPVTINKMTLLSKIALGSEFKKVIDSLGHPAKTLDITDQKKDSGFKMYLWENKPQILCVFYKDKLISKLTK
jgi:hypothetical protein